MRVATYNVHDCVGKDRRFSPERTTQVVMELRAEVVALQEVTLDHAGELIAYLQHTTGLCAIDGTVLERGVGRYGNLLLLRHGKVDQVLHDLSVDDREPRGALEALLPTEGGLVKLVATHLGLTRRERQTQIDRLSLLLDNTRFTTVLLGDFNVWWGSGELEPLRSRGFRHLAVRSFPTRWIPLVPLDRILAGPGAMIRRCWRHDTPLSRVASDHFPIVADIQAPANSGFV